MPRLIVTERAALGMARCRGFLAHKNVDAARRAGHTIAQKLILPETTPAMGRPFGGDMRLRELIIGFGDSGYVALYRHEPEEDVVLVLVFRQQREAGY